MQGMNDGGSIAEGALLDHRSNRNFDALSSTLAQPMHYGTELEAPTGKVNAASTSMDSHGLYMLGEDT